MDKLIPTILFFFCFSRLSMAQLENLDLPSNHPLRFSPHSKKREIGSIEKNGYLIFSTTYRKLPVSKTTGFLEINTFDNSSSPVSIDFYNFINLQNGLHLGEIGVESGEFRKLPYHFEFSFGYGQVDNFRRLYFQLGTGINFSLTEKNRFIIRPVIAMNYGNVRYKLGEIESEITISDKSFNSDGAEIFIKANPFVITPRLDFVLRLNTWLYFVASSGYQLAFNTDPELLFVGNDINSTDSEPKMIRANKSMPSGLSGYNINSRPGPENFFELNGLYFSIGLGFGNTKY